MANLITALRIALSVGIIFVPYPSALFYVLYIFAGVSDMADGFLARLLNTVSDLGAKLDTTADFIFLAVCFYKLLPIIKIPIYLWLWVLAIAVIKTVSIVITKGLVAAHNLPNKITGLLLFIFPLTLKTIPIIYSALILCTFAGFSAIYELLCIIKNGNDK